MTLFSLTSSLLGGLGLFMLGMWMMTDGLKLAAGQTLHDILSNWTRSRLRGLIAGLSITGVVQSSSAVTVATIGFVNAGLMPLQQAVWVIFGSNVGTTLTGWLVAMIGFKFKIELFALPMVGVGMLLKLTGANTRRAYIGQALLGFGLLFLGIDVLREGFSHLGALEHFPDASDGTLIHLGIYSVIGFVLTTLMQSSSAALVVILSAAAGGLVTLPAAAATVIGANLGTTTTAMLSVWGATSNAKRVAAAHVLFNLLTGVVALLILFPILSLVDWVRTLFKLDDSPASTLAVFHTAFNLLGVLLMWPLGNRLVAFLETRFKSAEEDLARPKYLDNNVLSVPSLALQALYLEVQRIGGIALSVSQGLLSADSMSSPRIETERNITDKLASAVGDFIARLYRENLPTGVVEAIHSILRAERNYGVIMDHAVEAAAEQSNLRALDDDELEALIVDYKKSLSRFFQDADTKKADFDLEKIKQQLELLEEYYDKIKNKLIKSSAQGKLSVLRMEAAIEQINHFRRMAQRASKAAIRLDETHAYTSTTIKTDVFTEPQASPNENPIDQSGLSTREA